MSEPIWTTVLVRLPKTWGETPPVVELMGEALINGFTDVIVEDDTCRMFQVYGEGNYGLGDRDLEPCLDWLREHRVPFIAYDEGKYEFPGTTIVFDGTDEYDSVNATEVGTVITQADWERAKESGDPVGWVDTHFARTNRTIESMSIDHLPANYPEEEE